MKSSLRKRCAALGGLILFTVVTGMILASSSTRADSTTDRVSWVIQPSCTMSSSIPAGSEHTTSMMSGEHKVDIGTTTVTVVCNDSEGLDIYVVGSSNNRPGNTKLISSLGPDYNIPTGVYSSGNTDSSWSMKLTNMNDGLTPVSGKFGSYISVPNTWDRVAYRDSSTGATAGTSFQTTYDVYASSTQPAGTYTGQVKYVMLHPHEAPRSNLVSLQMALYDALGNPTTTVDGSTTGTKYYRMQDMTTAICDAVTVIGGDSQIQLVDDRPDSNGIRKLYWATKLDDGNCWMTQNLDLDLVAGTTFTHANTDLGWTTSDTEATWKVGDGYSTIPWDATAGKFTGWDNQNALPYSADPGEKYYYTSNTTSNDATFNSMTQCLEAGHTQADCEHYHAGNYYNWTAAVAGNVTNSGNAPDSICPAGWRLPKTSADEFANLLVAHNVIPNISSTSYVTDGSDVKIGFNTIRKYPLYFVRSGSVNSGTLDNAASDGFYWSSTVNNANYARTLGFNSSNVYPAYIINGRYYGRSVRCMAR